MNLSIQRPVAFFDLETTGLDFANDRILEIAILKIEPDGTKAEYVQRFNPGMAIPAESTAIHGISDEDVKDEPAFKEKAKDIVDFIGTADLAGYNSNRFDIPFLLEELMRNGVELDMAGRRAVDVQTIFHKMEQRTLAAAYQFYCEKDLENAHSAKADTNATFEVLEAQLNRYPDLKNDIDFLEEFTQAGKNKIVDFVGRLAENEKGELMYNFGKHAGKTVKEVFKSEPGYHRWMLDNNFPAYTKLILKKETDKLIDSQRQHKAKKKEQEEKTMASKLEQLQNKFKS